LRAHKLRSLLTMLGVMIGIMAVVVMVAMIEGARADVVEEFEKLGSDVIIVAYDPSERLQRGERGGTVEGLTLKDFEAIRALPELRLATAERELGQKEIIYQGEKVQASVTGVADGYLTARALTLTKGDSSSRTRSKWVRSSLCWATKRRRSCSASATPSDKISCWMAHRCASSACWRSAGVPSAKTKITPSTCP
jgi:hypothetical protein